MLARTEEPSRFKLYAHDCGMLMSCYPIEVAADVLAGAKSVNFGAVYENFVAQELAAAGVKLRYYHNNGAVRLISSLRPMRLRCCRLR